MNKFVFTFAIFLSFSFSAHAVTDESMLIDLPQTASLRFKAPFTVTSMTSRYGTGKQAIVRTIDIDLTGKTLKARWSRHQNKAAIEALRELKYFAAIDRLFCTVSFNADIRIDQTLPKDFILQLSEPQEYGSPVEGLTELGERITISNLASDKSISGNFTNKIGNRLYCNFHTENVDYWGHPGFLSDLKIKHLKLLLASHFEVLY